jgi:hypothetical protein
LYHTAANTMGIYFSPMLAGPDLTRHFWLLAAVNCVAAVVVVIVDRKMWLSQRPVAPVSAEVVPSIS